MLEVLATGLLDTPQDLGRPGFAHLGIGRAGAADRVALRLANALVGNAENACALEVTLIGGRYKALAETWVAVVGPALPQARINDAALHRGRPYRLGAGDTLSLGPLRSGCRACLAVAGGLAVPAWLGSRSRDVNAGLGPPMPKAGDRLPLGEAGKRPTSPPDWGIDCSAWDHGGTPVQLRFLPGPEMERLDDASRRTLLATRFRISKDSNRVACRLEGAVLRQAEAGGIVTAASLDGSIQLPPNGQPIIFGCEHPVSGGYARIGQLIGADLPRLAQCRPGDEIVLREVSMAEAQAATARQQQELQQWQARIRARLEVDP